MKKTVSFVIIFAVLASMICVPAAAAGLNNFEKKNTYTDGLFTDVPSSQWYASSVAGAYELGLVNGNSSTTYNPTGFIRLSESIALADRIHSIYNGGTGVFEQGAPWYQVYVDYAVDNGIISKDGFSDYTAYATRAQFAAIMASALPADALPEINSVPDNSIPDVPVSAAYSASVYTLYRAGILTGSDNLGTFNPDSSIKRSEVAAIVTRMAIPAERQSISLKAPNVPLTSREISDKCSPAVFYIETYSLCGAVRASGSGFFISADGYALTNCHVITNTEDILITTTDGNQYSAELIDADYDNDVAMIKVDGSSFPYLTPSYDVPLQGQKVYAIGSPLGLSNTMSDGMISNAARSIDGFTYIQISTPINHGSSGGALLDESGHVIGITCGGFETTGDLNLAIPISVADCLSKDGDVYFVDEGVLLPGFNYVEDFGYFAGMDIVDFSYNDTGYNIFYDMTGFTDFNGVTAADRFANTIGYYISALEMNGMIESDTGYEWSFFYSTDDEAVLILLDFENLFINIIAENYSAVTPFDSVVNTLFSTCEEQDGLYIRRFQSGEYSYGIILDVDDGSLNFSRFYEDGDISEFSCLTLWDNYGCYSFYEEVVSGFDKWSGYADVYADSYDFNSPMDFGGYEGAISDKLTLGYMASDAMYDTLCMVDYMMFLYGFGTEVADFGFTVNY